MKQLDYLCKTAALIQDLYVQLQQFLKINFIINICKILASRGITSVAADGFGAPGVVVSYTNDPDVQNGKKFADNGVQIAAGVPLQCDEPADFKTFRLGLFGLDKLYDVAATTSRVRRALDAAEIQRLQT